MNKKSAVLLAVLMVVMSGIATAAYKDQINRDGHVLQRSDIALGGLMVGTTRAQVEAIYGAPTARTEPRMSPALDEMMDEYTYGTSFKVIFIKDMVMYLNTNAHNGIATPAGVTVGDPAERVMQTYGKPWRDTKYEDGSENLVYRDPYDIAIVFRTEQGKITYIGIVGSEGVSEDADQWGLLYEKRVQQPFFIASTFPKMRSAMWYDLLAPTRSPSRQ